MKKSIILVALFALPLSAFGVSQVIKQMEAREFMASIYTYNQENIFIYRVEDNLNPDVKCYVSVNDKTRSNNLSCVSVVKK